MDMKQKSSTNATCLKTLVVGSAFLYHCQYWCGIDLSLSQKFPSTLDPRILLALIGILGMIVFGYGIYRGRINLQKVIDDFNQKLTILN